MIFQEKNQLRNRYRKIRNSISDKDGKEKEIFNKLMNFEPYLNADTVFAYAAVGSEANVDRIFFHALSEGKKVALPVCCDKEGNMEFYIISEESDLDIGMFSIREPIKETCLKAHSTPNSVCFVPGLCFDTHGGRLGYGKGYYDRFLDSFKGITVGICFQECVTDTLELDEHDKKVTYLITDKNIYNFCK